MLVLNEVGDCLHLCMIEVDSLKLVMWAMKEYGVQESWTKIIVFESLYKYHRDLSWHSYEPIMFLNNGEILLLFNNRDVVCYNQESKSFREISIQATTSPFLAIAYCPSFISLYDVAEGEEVERY